MELDRREDDYDKIRLICGVVSQPKDFGEPEDSGWARVCIYQQFW